MIQNLIISLLPILISLILGWGIGKAANVQVRNILVGQITFLVWLLLISIGFQFGSVLFDKDLGSKILIEAFTYSTVLSVITFGLLFNRSHFKAEHQKSFKDMLKPITECLIAIGMVLIGMGLYWLLPKTLSGEILSAILLYVLIFLIGVDLSTIKIQALTMNHIKVPFFSIIALFIAAYLTSHIMTQSFVELVVMGSGFGWFSLSGPLVAKVLGPEQGTFALITDLVREFYAIALLYLLGQRYPKPIIGVCGATAMDSTLPFVKNNCSPLDVQIAILSGFFLTLIAPFFIIFFSSLI